MSNIIPPLLSSTPPPIIDNFDEDEDDEFGDYRTAGDLSFACDNLSIPPSPEISPKKNVSPSLDINSNNNKIPTSPISDEIITNLSDIETESKDFHDRRKSPSIESTISSRECNYASNKNLDVTPDVSCSTFNKSPENRRIMECSLASSERKLQNGYTHSLQNTEMKILTQENFDKSNKDMGCVDSEHVSKFEKFSHDFVSTSHMLLQSESLPLDEAKFSESLVSKGENVSQKYSTKDAKCDLSDVSVYLEESEAEIEKNSSPTETKIKFDQELPILNQNDSSNDENDDFGNFISTELTRTTENEMSNYNVPQEQNNCQLLHANNHNSFTNSKCSEEIKNGTHCSNKIQENPSLDSTNFSTFCSVTTAALSEIKMGEDENNIPSDDDSFVSNEDFNDSYSHNKEVKNRPPEQDLNNSFDEFFPSENNFQKSQPDEEFSNFVSEVLPPTVDAVENFGDFSPGVQPINEDVTVEDEFGDFSMCNEPLPEPPETKSEEFGDFNSNKKQVSPVHEDNSDDFDDFVACPEVSKEDTEETLSPPIESKVKDDDFGNFADFSSAPTDVINDDEFGDFTMQSIPSGSSDTEDIPVLLQIDTKDVFGKSEAIVKVMFELSNALQIDYQQEDIRNNKIFSALKDITETKALSYQWAKSSSQKALLKALSIDETEVLYGPSWNLSLPRFAANLSTAPLEPVKTDIISSNTAESPSTPSVVDVPSAQFDWSSSGLTNPLDHSQTMLLDLEHLVQSLDITSSLCTPKSNESVSPVDELEEWDLWLKSKAAKENAEKSQQIQEASISHTASRNLTTQQSSILLPSPSIPAIQPDILIFSSPDTNFVNTKTLPELFTSSKDNLEKNVQETEKAMDDFEFTDFQTSNEQNWSIPLRETHISDDKGTGDLEPVGWLQPTIVTPVLPRKEQETTLNDDDDFDDFQMVWPGNNSLKKTETASKADMISHPIVSSAPVQSCVENQVNSVDHDLFGSFKSSGPVSTKEPCVQLPPLDNNDLEDEFTDFHSSLPSDNSEAVKSHQLSFTQSIQQPILHPMALQPLIPTPLEPVKVVSAKPSSLAQIKWPEPGLTDEDLSNIELNYSIKPDIKEKEKEIKADDKSKLNVVPTPKKTKEKSLDDDDWSDFVSVQETVKTNILSSPKTERTSTPDLPLSVLNLGHVQPMRQPIPVITPMGLVQTQLPSSQTPLNVVQTSIYNSSVANHQPVNMQPSLITNQFIGQAYPGQATYGTGRANFVKSLPNTTLPVSNALRKSQDTALGSPVKHTKQNAPDDDDYWSDFISSKPVTQSSNGLQQRVAPAPSRGFNQFNQMNTLCENNTPNIITNPGHFDAFQNYVPPCNVSKGSRVTNLHSRKSALSSVTAVPELDFVAPKSRTSSRK